MSKARIKAAPNTFKKIFNKHPAKKHTRCDISSAGCLLVRGSNVFLGVHDKGLCDLGGKLELSESPWDAARRECHEECGFLPEAHHGSVVLGKYGKHELFVVSLPAAVNVHELRPIKSGDAVSSVIALTLPLWNSRKKLHPRLKFASGPQMVEIQVKCNKILF